MQQSALPTRACLLSAGMASSLGTGLAKQWAALQQPPPEPLMLRCGAGTLHADIPYRLLADFPLVAIERRLGSVIDTVMDEALTGTRLSTAERRGIALFIGSSSFDISVSEYRYRQALETNANTIPLDTSSTFGNLAEAVRQRFDLHGPDFSFNTACTSSANALWYASRLIATGQIRHALVLGVEVLNHVTAFGFEGLGLLARSVMKPFDANRNGLVLGEAVAAAVLGPGTTAGFHLLGGANLCDTHSMSAANADGSTVAAVIHAALAEAGLTATDITAIKSHGTASLLNDEAESSGLLQVFAGRPLPPVCALKPYLGHTLGACGIAELLLCQQALWHGQWPATTGIGADASVLGLSLTQHHHRVAGGNYLLNYFGFGGNNTALVIKTGDKPA